MELLFDPDLTAATAVILYISYFIDNLTNFSFSFFPSVSFSISHHLPFVSYRSTMLTLLAPVATHLDCHYVVTLSLVWPRFSLVHPLFSPLPMSLCISIRFVWRRIWRRPQPSCLNCNWKLQLISRRPLSCRVSLAQCCRTVRGSPSASLPWNRSWKVCIVVFSFVTTIIPTFMAVIMFSFCWNIFREGFKGRKIMMHSNLLMFWVYPHWYWWGRQNIWNTFK